MNFEPVSERILDSCADLYAEVFSSSPWNEPWTFEAALHRLTHFYHSRGFIGVLAKEDRVLGFALGNLEPFHSGNLFYLREMCISVGRQSEGLGKQLYHAVEGELSTRGVERVYLTTSRRIPASSFYQNVGFKYVEEMGFYAKRISS